MANWQNAPYGLRPSHSILGGSWTETTNPYKIYTNDDEAGRVGLNQNLFTGDPVVWGTSRAIADTATGLVTGGMGTVARYNPNFADGTPSTYAGVGAAPILGVFVGCEYLSTQTAVNNIIRSAYYPAGTRVVPGTEITAYVINDPMVVYDIQVSSRINANANAFVGLPVLPNTNGTGGAPFPLMGTFGSNFALDIGGGTNFTTVVNAYTVASGISYANNPLTGNTRTGQSAFYLSADTSTVAGYNNHDYNKNVITLPLKALGYSTDPNNVAAAGLTLETTPFLSIQVTLNNPVYSIGSAPTVYIA
jgi:hypothetical protein